MAKIIRTQGFAELRRRLLTLSADMQDKVGRSAAAAGAEVIRQAASEKAPVSGKAHKLDGKLVEPGNLKRNIIKRRERKPEQYTHEYDVTWGPKAYYGQFVELGTVKDAPQPYLRPALDASKEAAIAAIGKALDSRLKKEGA